jgi:protein-S-isoprenylcysteine O-methyltransferase Ste14
VARIQRDRGHQLITAGPYKFIRHPGYAAAITWLAVSGIALGSWISVAPALIGGVYFFLRRLRIEEALLFAELEGYREYAQRVPYRLVPGIW